MKKFISMLIVLILLMLVWWVYGKVSVVETRITAVSGEYEDSFNAKGIIIRDEYPITAEFDGVLQSSVPSGTRVTKYTNVAYIYSGSADKAVIEELEKVNARIDEINAIQDSTLLSLTDPDEITARITSYSEQLAKKSADGNGADIKNTIDEINLLISRKRYIEGESVGENNDLTSLTARRTELENRLGGGRVALGAPISGLYYDFVDGYEGITVSDAAGLTAEKINKIISSEDVGAKIENAVCKITDNSTWVISLAVGKDDVAGLSEGQTVEIRLGGSDEQPAHARVSKVVTDGKKSVLNLEGSSYIGSIYSDRTCTVDVIKNTYRGLKIPLDAITDKGDAGKTVTVRTSGGEIEKTVTVLYESGDGTAIVKTGTEQGELLLYDEVILKKNRK